MKKCLALLTICTALASCSQFDKWKTPTKGQSKSTKQSAPAFLDPKAESGPTTGHSYYLPSSPKMESKSKSATNTAVKSGAVKNKSSKKSATSTTKKVL